MKIVGTDAEKSSAPSWAVRDYKRSVKTAKRWAPSSLNQSLAAIDNFYRSLAIGRPDVPREELPQVAPAPWTRATGKVPPDRGGQPLGANDQPEARGCGWFQHSGNVRPEHHYPVRITEPGRTPRQVGLWGVVSIGIGGMVGGGIFAVLGLSVQIAKGGAPIAFLVAGGVALLTARSYALLSKSYPSKGGTVTFVNKAFGTGLFPGGMNVLLWLSYIVMLSLYSQAFGSYAASLLPHGSRTAAKHLFLSLAVVLITMLNIAAASTVARAERVVVVIKLVILVLFVAVGFAGISSSRLAPGHWSSPVSLVAGGMIVFLAYEGFELIANAAEDVADPGRTLPQAYYISVLFVIVLYVLVAVVSVGSVPVAQLVQARDYALALAARPALGSVGFKMIAIAAMLSTASAINATLYGTGRLSYTIARNRELPERLEEPIWSRPLAGLFITAGATLVLANVLNLASISTMGSAGFLIIFGVVNAAEARTSQERSSQAWVSAVAALACAAALVALIAKSSEGADAFLGAMVVLAFGIEAGSRLLTGRTAAESRSDASHKGHAH